MCFLIASKAPVDMDLDPETWDNKTITSGLKNYLRSACPTSCVPLAITNHYYLHKASLKPPWCYSSIQHWHWLTKEGECIQKACVVREVNGHFFFP